MLALMLSHSYNQSVLTVLIISITTIQTNIYQPSLYITTMKIAISSLAIVFGLSLLPSPVAANTPDLCTADIEDLRLMKPSECDPTGRVGPDITIGSTVYNNNEAHFVIGSPIAASMTGRNLRRNLKSSKGSKGSKSSKE